jgi:phosphate/sulfate permease
VGEILLSWAGTLPLGAALGSVLYLLLVRLA